MGRRGVYPLYEAVYDPEGPRGSGRVWAGCDLTTSGGGRPSLEARPREGAVKERKVKGTVDG